MKLRSFLEKIVATIKKQFYSHGKYKYKHVLKQINSACVCSQFGTAAEYKNVNNSLKPFYYYLASQSLNNITVFLKQNLCSHRIKRSYKIECSLTSEM